MGTKSILLFGRINYTYPTHWKNFEIQNAFQSHLTRYEGLTPKQAYAITKLGFGVRHDSGPPPKMQYAEILRIVLSLPTQVTEE